MDVGVVAQLGSALWNLKVMCDQYDDNKREIKELQSFMQDYGEVIPALTQHFKEGGGNALGIGALENLEKDITEAISKLERWSRNKKFFRVFTSTDRMQKLVNLHSKVMASVQKSSVIANLSMLLNVQATLLESNMELKSLLMTSIGSVHGTLPPKVRDEVVEASTSSFADPKFWEDILATVDTHNGKFPLSEDLSMYEDPITSNLVIDPVVCSDGNTYCRWTIIDNHLTKSPLNMGEDLSIVVDNLSLRRGLFERFPDQFEVFQQRRKEYRGHALSMFGQGMLGDAVLALQYVIQWDKRDVEAAELLAQAQRALEEAEKDCLHPSLGLPSEVCMFPSQLRVIVGLDFGTTHSGFAFAHITDLDKILTTYEYPHFLGERPYCKTLTASYYKQVNGVWEFRNWGFPARGEYERDIAALKAKRHGHASVGSYFTDFKLRLAGSPSGPSSLRPLPPGLTVDVLITDYLRAMGEFILRTLRESYGPLLSRKEIQWCITVPSFWDNAAKATMRTCMAAAGLLNGLEGSQHPLIVVLEPEAASFHCLKVMSEQVLEIGDKLLVADIGGATADIVVQEVVSGQNQSRNSSYRVKEVTISSGGLCGGTHVDMRFMEFLHTKIGPCLKEFLIQYPNMYNYMIKSWEEDKFSFGDPSQMGESIELILPSKLESEWEKYDVRMGNPERDSYDDLEITYEEMQSIFDPVIDRNLELIDHQLQQVGGVKVLAVVGGFAASPYLLSQIKHRFGGQVCRIISPPNPGIAVCQGAVALALHPTTIDSRISKKTYGLRAVEPFVEGVDPPELGEYYDGVLKCNSRFEVFVRKGDHVKPKDCITRLFMPVNHGQTAFELELFSSEEMEPRYVVGEGVRQEGKFIIDISGDMRLEKERRLNVSLFFGKSSIEIVVKGLNFVAGGSSSLKSTPAFE